MSGIFAVDGLGYVDDVLGFGLESENAVWSLICVGVVMICGVWYSMAMKIGGCAVNHLIVETSFLAALRRGFRRVDLSV